MKQIEIVEVCPRDGFQNIKLPIPTALKKQVIDQIVDAGLKNIEITSMVSPKAIPQLADAKEIIDYVLSTYPMLHAIVLVPNLKGAQLVHERGVRNINYVVSVSAAHNKANINRSHEESINDMQSILNQYPDLNMNLSLATAFGCPFIGATKIDDMLKILASATNSGIKSVTLCDTIGVANPKQTENIISIIQQHYPDLKLALHMHNTHGMALANMLVALNMGIKRFETAIGGLGGCPFAPGAAGNISTEDAINMFNRMGYSTGLDIEKIIAISHTIRDKIEPNLTSNLSKATTYNQFNFNDSSYCEV